MATQTFNLCEPIPVAVLLKNVKIATVTDLLLEWDIPSNGAAIIPGSFEISYPNSGDLSLPFTSIPDPTINGTNLSYADDAIFSSQIDQFGLPGVNVTADSNQFVIRFQMFTDCDEFVSGSKTFFDFTAADPCTPERLASGLINSNSIIINGANPVNFAQILTTAKPADAYCGAQSTEFNLTGLNISEVGSGDSVQICLTFPEEIIYETGSVQYNIPANYPTGVVTETMIGNNTQLCFDGVANLPVGGQFTVTYKGVMTTAATCDGVRIGVDVKEYVEDVICATGANCDVWVQSSVNNDFGVNLNPPIEVLDLTLNSECVNYGDSVVLCYEAMLFNPGPDYTGDINITLHDDITGNSILDYYDPVFGSDLYPSETIVGGDTIIVTKCFTVDEPNACPVIMNIDYSILW
jgi:hypothetical protein